MTTTQCMTALQRAHAVRMARAEIRRQLLEREITAVDVLDDVPDTMASLPVGEFLTWIPGVGKHRAGKLLSDKDGKIVGENVPLGVLSLHTRCRLALQLPDPQVREAVAA